MHRQSETPQAELDERVSSPDVTPGDWAEAVRRLDEAQIYWQALGFGKGPTSSQTRWRFDRE